MILSTTVYEWVINTLNTPGFKPALIFFILTIIEVTPIKFNPWSFIGGLIGRLLGIEAIKNQVTALDEKVDENQAINIRVRILRFEDEIQMGKIHSKDSWDQVMDDINRYETYTESHPKFKNNITVASTQHIKNKYVELLEKRAWTTKLNGD